MTFEGIAGIERSAFVKGYLAGADAATPWSLGSEMTEADAVAAFHRWLSPIKAVDETLPEKIDSYLRRFGSLGPVTFPC